MKLSSTRFAQRIGAGLVVAAIAGAGMARVQAQTETAFLIVLDKDALDYGPAPHLIPLDGVEALNSKVGLRDEMPSFSRARRTGTLAGSPSGPFPRVGRRKRAARTG